MTAAYVILALVLVMGSATAWLLLRRSKTADITDGDQFAALAAGLDRYQVMGRLLAKEDFDFACQRHSLGRDARNWLLTKRRRIMRSYLRELRRDFNGIWSACRALTPYVEDPEFGAVLMQQLISFYSAYALFWLRLSSNATCQVRIDTDELVGAIRALREGALQAVQGTQDLSYQTRSSGV